jgi:hypothetical protein
MQRYLAHTLIRSIFHADSSDPKRAEAMYLKREIWKLLEGQSALLTVCYFWVEGYGREDNK